MVRQSGRARRGVAGAVVPRALPTEEKVRDRDLSGGAGSAVARGRRTWNVCSCLATGRAFERKFGPRVLCVEGTRSGPVRRRCATSGRRPGTKRSTSISSGAPGFSDGATGRTRPACDLDPCLRVLDGEERGKPRRAPATALLRDVADAVVPEQDRRRTVARGKGRATEEQRNVNVVADRVELVGGGTHVAPWLRGLTRPAVDRFGAVSTRFSPLTGCEEDRVIAMQLG